jgi:hypothetical protein
MSHIIIACLSMPSLFRLALQDMDVSSRIVVLSWQRVFYTEDRFVVFLAYLGICMMRRGKNVYQDDCSNYTCLIAIEYGHIYIYICEKEQSVKMYSCCLEIVLDLKILLFI